MITKILRTKICVWEKELFRQLEWMGKRIGVGTKFTMLLNTIDTMKK